MAERLILDLPEIEHRGFTSCLDDWGFRWVRGNAEVITGKHPSEYPIDTVYGGNAFKALWFGWPVGDFPTLNEAIDCLEEGYIPSGEVENPQDTKRERADIEAVFFCQSCKTKSNYEEVSNKWVRMIPVGRQSGGYRLMISGECPHCPKKVNTFLPSGTIVPVC